MTNESLWVYERGVNKRDLLVMVWLNGLHSVKNSSGRSGGISVKFCTSKSFPPYGTKQACLIGKVKWARSTRCKLSYKHASLGPQIYAPENNTLHHTCNDAIQNTAYCQGLNLETGSFIVQLLSNPAGWWIQGHWVAITIHKCSSVAKCGNTYKASIYGVGKGI